MRPKTRAVKASKVSKENINILSKTNSKSVGIPSKPTRKPLADKTNSASDGNASPEPLKKVIKTSARPSRKVVAEVVKDKAPRRNRRLPNRYLENQLLNNLSNSKDNVTSPSKLISKTPVKDDSKKESPFRTPNSALDNSLRASRPRRLGRLPSKFDENSVSPNKFLPIQPCYTSTPLVVKAKEQPRNVHRTSGNKQAEISEKVIPQKVASQMVTPQKQTSKNVTPQKVTAQKVTPQKVVSQKVTPQHIKSQRRTRKGKQQKELEQKLSPKKVAPQKTKNNKILVQKKLSEVVKQNTDKDSNVRQERVRRLRKPVEYKEITLSPKIKSPEISKPKDAIDKKISKINTSFKVLEEKKNKNVDNQDIYEFTFDPADEPPPQKKKRKKVPAKKPAKPKTRVYKNNYEKNLARALADLKNVVGKQKPQYNEAASKVSRAQIPTGTNNQAQLVASTSTPTTVTSKPVIAPNPSSIVISTTADVHCNPVFNNSVICNASNKNYASIRVEDIAADFEETVDHDLNYSPNNSPHPADVENHPREASPERNAARSDDPLNLRNDLSFFDEQPVASSSINMSTRNPMATPWRVEFESLPIKWQANTYVKPDMTPALESSYINNFDDSRKKHVYTNMLAQENEPLPEMEQNEAPKLKQTSIISFIKEQAEKSANKKNRRGVGQKKANSLFDDPNIPVDPALGNQTTSVASPQKETTGASQIDSSAENNASTESKKSKKRKHDGDIHTTPAKVSRNENDNTLFGFDDSENQEQENVSPFKVLNTKRLHSLRSRSGAVLQEINKHTGPMRANLPVAMKSKMAPSSDVVEKIYDQIKSANDAPVLLDQPINGETTNVGDMPDGVRGDEDSQSVHLFEDIELINHFKPACKSYRKAVKKVAFNQHSSDIGDEAPARNLSSDDDEPPARNIYSDDDDAPARNLSSDDDPDDLSFHLPEFKTKKATKKKKTKKQLLSKKEKAEVEAWAASFNSMCEDIEEFDLLVE